MKWNRFDKRLEIVENILNLTTVSDTSSIRNMHKSIKYTPWGRKTTRSPLKSENKKIRQIRKGLDKSPDTRRRKINKRKERKLEKTWSLVKLHEPKEKLNTYDDILNNQSCIEVSKDDGLVNKIKTSKMTCFQVRSKSSSKYHKTLQKRVNRQNPVGFIPNSVSK